MLLKQEIENWTWVFGSELVSFVIHVYHIFGLPCVFFGIIYTPRITLAEDCCQCCLSVARIHNNSLLRFYKTRWSGASWIKKE